MRRTRLVLVTLGLGLCCTQTLGAAVPLTVKCAVERETRIKTNERYCRTEKTAGWAPRVDCGASNVGCWLIAE